MNSLRELAERWSDDPDTHQRIYDSFTLACENDFLTREHWKWTADNGMGFGCSAFTALWKVVVDSMPPKFSFLEIGVYRGQITSLIGALADRIGRQAFVVGISTFDARNLVPPVPPENCTHYDDTWEAWRKWTTPQSSNSFLTIRADSTSEDAIKGAKELGPFDICYIDASHDFFDCGQDLWNYSPMVKKGGLLFCDDSACHLNLPGSMFRGFPGASQAVDALLPPFTVNENWKYLGNVTHLRIWRRV